MPQSSKENNNSDPVTNQQRDMKYRDCKYQLHNYIPN